jgi:hypothetical protein
MPCREEVDDQLPVPPTTDIISETYRYQLTLNPDSSDTDSENDSDEEIGRQFQRSSTARAANTPARPQASQAYSTPVSNPRRALPPVQYMSSKSPTRDLRRQRPAANHAEVYEDALTPKEPSRVRVVSKKPPLRDITAEQNRGSGPKQELKALKPAKPKYSGNYPGAKMMKA